ncbi:MAG TPA: ABC transporter permease [Bryobacteraceae bacterium]|nr:ABC transporter permease [Bryobacteraceae bacterium]
MRLLDSLRARLSTLFQRSQVNAEMDEELGSHIQLRADDLELSGLARADAERRARIEFGGRERFKEEVRETFLSSFIEVLIQDLRYGLRVLRKSPGFTITAVVTLALAIGANAVVFGILNGLILRPLNVPQAQDLFMIERARGNGYSSYPDYVDLRDRNRSFDGLTAYNIDAAALDTGDNPSKAWLMEVSGNYFDALRIQPHLGRFFHDSDEHGPNSAPYIVLAYTFWHTHFQDDRGVVGRVVQLNKHPFTIVGVAPPEFHGTLLFLSPDFFVPIVNQEQVAGISVLNARGTRSGIFSLLGHLKAGITPAQASADLNSIGSYLENTYPKDDGHVNFELARPSLYGNFLGPPVRAFVTGLMLLAGLILLAACANLGSLFAARAADRSREVALRLALGAKRSRILRALFTEAVMISLVGGAFGLWASVALLRVLAVWQPVPRFPAVLPVNPDAYVYGVAVVLAVASGILFGLVPVRQVLRVDSYQIVKSGSTGTAGRRITVRDLLLVAQISICAVLITSSIVAVRGLLRSLNSSFGFEPRNAMLVTTDLNMAGYRGDAVPVMQKRLIKTIEAIPGVESVGFVDRTPLYGGGRGLAIYADEATDLRPSKAADTAYKFAISPEYFHAAGTALLAGRALSWHDDENSPHVAVVNRQFAGKIFSSATNAVGRYFKQRDGTRVQVVGVVEDGKYLSLTEDPETAVFVPFQQSPNSETSLVVRSSRDPLQLAPALKSALRDLDRGLPTYIATWSNELGFSLFPSRVATVSLGVMGVLGAMLSITGIFGMAAYSVSKRLKELGIRLALGARRKQVLQSALGRAVKLLAFGSTAGLVFGLLATRVLSHIVYQATPRDPLVLTGVVLAMALLGLAATWIPAQRALSVDPLKLLREE